MVSMVFEKAWSKVNGCIKDLNNLYLAGIEGVFFDFSLRSHFSPMKEEALFGVASSLALRSLLEFFLDSRFTLVKIGELFCIDPLLSATENMVTRMEDKDYLALIRKRLDPS